MAFFERRGGVTLYFPGPMATAKLPGLVAATKELLRDFGIPFIMIDDLVTTGYHAWYGGDERLFNSLQERVRKLLKEQNVKQVITNDPHEALTLRERYQVEAYHILEVIDENLEKVQRGEAKRVSYHHPCFLKKLGVEPRLPLRILRRRGLHVPSENKADGCCGSVGDDYARNNTALAGKIAARRVTQLPEPLLVTSCPYCHIMFKKQKRASVDVVELLVEGA